MPFHYKSSIPVPYNRQGYIYFSSMLYKDLPKERRKAIDKICKEAGGQYAEALKEYVTTGANPATVARKYYMSERTLHRVACKYYIRFSRYIM